MKVVQGDTTMRAQTLDVFYDGDGSTANALTSAQPGPGGQQRIKRLDVKGGVKVCQNDQIVTGNEGIFDMQANTVTLQGNVVLTKEQNVLKGDRLVVDLTTGAAKIDGGKSGGASALLIPIVDPGREKEARAAIRSSRRPPTNSSPVRRRWAAAWLISPTFPSAMSPSAAGRLRSICRLWAG